MAEMASWDQNINTCTKASTLDPEIVSWLIMPRNNGNLSACLLLCVCSCVQKYVYLSMCVEARCQPEVDLKLSTLFWRALFIANFLLLLYFFFNWGLELSNLTRLAAQEATRIFLFPCLQGWDYKNAPSHQFSFFSVSSGDLTQTLLPVWQALYWVIPQPLHPYILKQNN